MQPDSQALDHSTAGTPTTDLHTTDPHTTDPHTTDPHTTDPHTTARALADLDRRLAEASTPAPATVQRQHDQGRLTARERVLALLDDGSFSELDSLSGRHHTTSFDPGDRRLAGDGVITGTGTVDGRTVCVYSQDVAVFGGSLGQVHGEKVCKVLDLAMTIGCPVIGLVEGGGARIQEGVVSLGLHAEIFRRNILASGVVPQVSVVLGATAGEHAYSPALTDIVVMVEGAGQMFLTGPDVVRTVTGEQVSAEALGGGRVHATRSGLAHHLAPDESQALQWVRDLLGFLPQNNCEDPPIDPDAPDEREVTELDETLDTLIPDSANQPYDMHRVLDAVLDDGHFLEVQALYATTIICGFGRVGGRPVGVVANQPMVFAGCLDGASSEKAARFIRTCDAFNVPVVTFVDVPGFLPGTEQEHTGAIRRGAKLLHAYAEATVPLVTVITRKAHGSAYCVMGSKHLGVDVNLAWPTAEIAVMGADAAVTMLHRRELEGHADPEGRRQELVDEYTDELLNPWTAAAQGYLDRVIPPRDTRLDLHQTLLLLTSKRVQRPPKKHGNIPL